MQCSITFEVLHIKLYALFKGAGAWPVVPHIIEVLDTGVKYLFGPLFCSQLVADLNCVNSTPVNFGRGNNTKGLKLKKRSMLRLFLLWIWTGECGKYKIWQTKDCDHWGKTIVRDLMIIAVNVQHGTIRSSHFMCTYQRNCRKWKSICNYVTEFCKTDDDVVCFAS